MGQTSANIQREVEELRRETSWIVEELEQRAGRATDVRRQVEAHPYVTIGFLALLGAVVGMIGARLVRRGAVGDRATTARELTRASESLGEVAGESQKERFFGLLKRLVFSMVAAAAVALSSLLARRLVASLWTATFHEPTPKERA